MEKYIYPFVWLGFYKIKILNKFSIFNITKKIKIKKQKLEFN